MAQNARYACNVKVKTTYLAEQSQPDEAKFAFAYTVTITNIGSVAAQLISRHWIITNAAGEVEEVLEGRAYRVQYFERRRMELHPEFGAGTVLLGLLGNDYHANR